MRSAQVCPHASGDGETLVLRRPGCASRKPKGRANVVADLHAEGLAALLVHQGAVLPQGEGLRGAAVEARSQTQGRHGADVEAQITEDDPRSARRRRGFEAPSVLLRVRRVAWHGGDVPRRRVLMVGPFAHQQGAGVARPLLVDRQDLLVADNGPHHGEVGLVGHIQCQRKRRGRHAPCGEMRPALRKSGQTTDVQCSHAGPAVGVRRRPLSIRRLRHQLQAG
mmetsp:Transcript_118471/g.342546  ORF Transcript_118471/g.342546 Transcript_118471/m.342546 type:complete len:223 (-) Transcript_118471:495-1163(-)